MQSTSGEVVLACENDVEALINLEKSSLPPWLWGGSDAIIKHLKEFADGIVMVKKPNGDCIGALFAKKTLVNNATDEFPPQNAIAGKTHYDYVKHASEGNALIYTSVFFNSDVDLADHYKPTRIVIDLQNGMKIDDDIKFQGYALGTTNYYLHKYGKYAEFMWHWNSGNPLTWRKYSVQRFSRPGGGQVIDPVLNGFWNNSFTQEMDFKRSFNDAINITVSIDQFNGYRLSYKPNTWKQIGENIWECFSEGLWYINSSKNMATYVEGRVWCLHKF